MAPNTRSQANGIIADGLIADGVESKFLKGVGLACVQCTMPAAIVVLSIPAFTGRIG